MLCPPPILCFLTFHVNIVFPNRNLENNGLVEGGLDLESVESGENLCLLFICVTLGRLIPFLACSLFNLGTAVKIKSDNGALYLTLILSDY